MPSPRSPAATAACSSSRCRCCSKAACCGVSWGSTSCWGSRPAVSRRAAARARDFLEAHYADEVSLADLAHLAGLSRYYMSRVFRRAYGLPPHAYQVQLRIAHARRLLRLGRPPAEVAATTGFADQSHFHRRFTRIVGVTPASYREGKNVQDHPARQA